MTARNPEHKAPPSRRAVVLDPKWEDELRRGQEEDGEAGSLDAELAVVHLLRHACAPEPLDDDALSELWSRELAPAIAPTPWYRRRWLWGAVPAVAAAAVVMIVVVSPDRTAPTITAAADRAPAAPGVSTSQLLAQQFAQLEPAARGELGDRIDDDRGVLRHDLLALAHGDKP